MTSLSVKSMCTIETKWCFESDTVVDFLVFKVYNSDELVMAR